MSKHLEDQVARIIDEGEGRTRSVIVQMSYDQPDTEDILSTVTAATRRRSMSASARDLLPARAEMFRKAKAGEATRTTKRHLKSAKMSMASQMAVAAPKRVTKRSLAREGIKVLNPLLASETAQRSFEKMTSRKGKTPLPEGLEGLTFWSSGSAVLEVSTDDLAKLGKEVPEISDIFPNRTLSVPPVVEPTSLPANVTDNKTSAWGIQAIGALAAWGAYGERGRGIRIGVLDTGIDASHPDLAGKVAAWAEFNRIGQTVSDSTPHDSGEHGTHVAGTLVGGNSSGQWIGVAPEAKLAVGMVLTGGAGTDAQILAGMEWAIEQGVEVISMSLGGLRMGPDVLDTYTRTIISANRLGIPVVTAIGNEGSQTSGAPGNDYFAFTVGATDSEDRPAGFSGGRTQIIRVSRYIADQYLPLVYSKPDVSAPGVAVKSAVPGGDYKTWNGTSMATPHVAGAIALLLGATGVRAAVGSSELAYILQDLITSSVEELGEAGQDHRFGFGRIDVLRAIGFAEELGY
jgi:subtilisin family serine protease